MTLFLAASVFVPNVSVMATEISTSEEGIVEESPSTDASTTGESTMASAGDETNTMNSEVEEESNQVVVPMMAASLMADPEDVVIDETTFPDEELRNQILSRVPQAADGILTLDELNAVTSLYLYGASINNLKGLEYFQNVTSFKTSSVTFNCDLDLSIFPKLTYVNTYWTTAPSINLTGLNQLDYLDISGLGIKELDLSSNYNLRSLGVRWNKLTALDLTQTPFLVNPELAGQVISEKNTIWKDGKWTVDLNEFLTKNQLPYTYFDNIYGDAPEYTIDYVTGVAEFSGLDKNNAPDYLMYRYITNETNPGSNPINIFYVTVPLVAVHSYEATFESNGGSLVENQIVQQTEAFVEPEVPMKEGYFFDGWYSDPELTQVYDFTKLATADVTLYAKWTPKNRIAQTYTVTYESNGGSATDSQVVIENDLVTRGVEPVKSGFAFKGWYSDKELTKSYDFNTPVTADITLYAKWEKNSIEDSKKNNDMNSEPNDENGVSTQKVNTKTSIANKNVTATNAKSSHLLPRTGESANYLWSIAGLVIVGVGFWFLRKNKL